ncbi:MAG: M28 family metallopeptidase [Bacteroidia bacterium]
MKNSIIRHSVALWLFLPTVYCLLSTSFCEAQNDVLKYAHQIVDTLASPSMHGRGYVLKGDSIAADYIKKEFERFGVKPIGKEFYQKFSFPVNTFPGNIYISYKKIIYEGDFEAGTGFRINPASPTIKGKYKWIEIDSALLNDQRKIKSRARNRFIVIDTSGLHNKEQKNKYEILINHAPKNSKGVIVVTQRGSAFSYPWEMSLFQNQYPIIETPFKPGLKKIFVQIEAKFIPNYTSQNIIGYIEGTQHPDSFIVFSSHYDHLGEIGGTFCCEPMYFPGANDNASGCAMLLNLVKYYSQHPPKYSVAFFAFGAEEMGLLGSDYYVQHPLFPLKQIKFLVNFDIVGTGDEGIKVVNATEHKKEFDELVQLNSKKNLLPSVQPRGKAGISDHYFFEEAGVKAFYIYTLGGIKAYHDIYDRAETLPLTKFEELYKLVIDFENYLEK